MRPTAPPALRALLAGSVDYAGLFPPAGLALEAALENQAGYVRGDDAWMLGYFVLPVAKLVEAGPLLTGRFDAEHPLRVSALGRKTASADEFLSGLVTGLRTVADFQAEHGATVLVEQLEAPLPLDATPGLALDSLLWEAACLLEEAQGVDRTLHAFWELPFSDDLPAVLLEFAEHSAWVSAPASRPGPDAPVSSRSPTLPRCQPFGAKLRTGGVEAAAFPTTGQLAAALLAARDTGVALKFTAGLHHPLRHFSDDLKTRMHGFLNVYAAAIFAREHRLDAAETRDILEDERPENFRFDDNGFAWRGRHVSTVALAAHRQLVTSFGSCSFDEPRDDLRRLGLMT